MNQIGEIGMAVGILLLVAIFRLGDGDPLKKPHKIPACLIVNVGGFEAPTTVDVWSDFAARDVAKDPRNHCGPCGRPVECPHD